MKAKIQRQKVSDDEDIDINKIARDDKPKDDRNSATKTEKQYKEKEAKRLALEKAKRIQMQKDMKDIQVKRLAIEKAQIEALIEKHRPCTPKTPDEVSRLGTGKNAKVNGQEGNKKEKSPYKKATKEKFIETIPAMIQTHLITCKDWATVKDTAKSLKHIILKCDQPTPAMPMMATGATVPGLYSHIAHSVDKEETWQAQIL